MAKVSARPNENPSPQDVNKLFALFAAARYLEAAALAQAMTNRFPRHPFGWKALGLTLRMAGRKVDALAPARRAVALSPQDAEAHSNLGSVLSDLGQLADAAVSFRRALAIKPDFAEVQGNLGNVLHGLGQLEDAMASYRRALALKPDNAQVHNNLCVILRVVGRLEEAEVSGNRAVTLKPDYAQAHNNLGATLKDLGRLEAAEASYLRAVELKPDYAEAHYNLGQVLKDLRRLEAAEASYRRAVEIKPDFAEAHNNLGAALQDIGRFDEAVASYRRSLEIKPDYAEAHNSLGAALNDLGHPDEAAASYRRALEIKPDLVEALSNLGSVLKDLGKPVEAMASCRRALAIEPDFTQVHSNLVLTMLYHAGNEAELIDAELHRWNEQHAVPLKPDILAHANERSPERRLRIGYVSPDFRDHVVGYNLLPLFERHDHRNFEIFGYAQVTQPDVVTRRFQSCCDHWCDVVPCTDAQLADRIRQDRIDILVDLALHTAHNRLPAFARKPAPVQVSFAGYPGGAGLEALDYHLTDAFLEPPHVERALSFDEAWHLPASFWCYEGLAVELPVGSLPAVAEGRVTFGCLNNFCKFNDRTLQLWARVVRSVAGSRLLMFAPNGSARERTLSLLEQAGLTADRVEFSDRLSRENYFALYGRIDIGLDTFPYNGHTTSLDSYWMGVPVVTLVGATAVSRAGWSQLSNLGLTEFAAETPDEYVRIASQLASDLPRLATLRAGLRERMRRSPLMDGAQFARGIESAYRTMWQRWCGRRDGAPCLGSPSTL